MVKSNEGVCLSETSHQRGVLHRVQVGYGTLQSHTFCTIYRDELWCYDMALVIEKIESQLICYYLISCT